MQLLEVTTIAAAWQHEGKIVLDKLKSFPNLGFRVYNLGFRVIKFLFIKHISRTSREYSAVLGKLTALI